MLTALAKKKLGKQTPLKEIFTDEKGAIDVASIMVGIIVIALIGGVIASTVFVVIPWTQDNTAKQQLDAIVQAENAYFGLSSAVPSPLPTGSRTNSFGGTDELKTASLLNSGPTYCVVTTDNNKGFAGYAKSSSGTVWSVTNTNSKPIIHTGPLPTDCQFSETPSEEALPGHEPTVPYIDPTPTKTVLTFQCDTTITGRIPMDTNLTGTETWDDGTPSRSYTNATVATAKSLTAGVTYTVTFDGTYKKFDLRTDLTTRKWASCLRSVDHWGSQTGVTSAYYAFAWASNLTDVPDHIPTTITSMENMFQDATIFNDPSVSKWDTSNVTNMNYTFGLAPVFNQPLNDWDVSNVTTMKQMFVGSPAFNKPLDKWNTSKVTTMYAMFSNASSFNQPLNTWKVGNVTNMDRMFYKATAFNRPLDTWDVSKVTNMYYMFGYTPDMYNDLSMWNTASLTDGTYFKYQSKLPYSYIPPKTS